MTQLPCWSPRKGGRELVKSWKAYARPDQQPSFFFCDPTDRSSELKRFLENYLPGHGTKTVGEVLASKDASDVWRKIASSPQSITGATSAITCVQDGAPVFTTIFNYITQEIFLACSAGVYRYKMSTEEGLRPGAVTTESIIDKGVSIEFPAPTADVGSWKAYVTFLGKSGYKENFDDSQLFVEEDVHLIYDSPGGPSRPLYLSNLAKSGNSKPAGFILANGEKIGEWIHWLSFVRFAISRGEHSLVLYEIMQERPWTKGGVLMSPPPPYSLFQPDGHGFLQIDVSQLARFENPSLFRSTLLLAHRDNEWVTHEMHQRQYRKIGLSPRMV